MDKIRRYIVVNAKKKLKDESVYNYALKRIEYQNIFIS